jgi:hypothetical protein
VAGCRERDVNFLAGFIKGGEFLHKLIENQPNKKVTLLQIRC